MYILRSEYKLDKWMGSTITDHAKSLEINVTAPEKSHHVLFIPLNKCVCGNLITTKSEEYPFFLFSFFEQLGIHTSLNEH